MDELAAKGNRLANDELEYHWPEGSPPKPDAESTAEVRQTYIVAKYAFRAFSHENHDGEMRRLPMHDPHDASGNDAPCDEPMRAPTAAADDPPLQEAAPPLPPGADCCYECSD